SARSSRASDRRSCSAAPPTGRSSPRRRASPRHCSWQRSSPSRRWTGTSPTWSKVTDGAARVFWRGGAAVVAHLGFNVRVGYVARLGDAPMYLNRDKMFCGLTAQSLATPGRDPQGRFLPLYFQTQMRYGSEMWFQPMLTYAAAASVKLLGLSEGTIRLPMALAGVLDVLLVYAIARQLMVRRLSAIAAAILLGLTPAHLINARVAMDFQMPLPFLLGWLLSLLRYMRYGGPRLLFGAGVLLGAGLFTYIAAVAWMSVYAGLTVTAL